MWNESGDDGIKWCVKNNGKMSWLCEGYGDGAEGLTFLEFVCPVISVARRVNDICLISVVFGVCHLFCLKKTERER